nr:carboxylate--amine ligase [uncultured Sulfurimonas sp.]
MYKQQTRNFVYGLSTPNNFNINLLDDWLKSALDIEEADFINSNKSMELLVNRQMLFIRSLMQSILLPYFDLGTILKIKKESNSSSKWNVNINLVNIEQIPNLYYETIINFAIKNVEWMMNNQKSIENKEKLYKRVEKEIIHKLKNFSNSGKSTMPILYCVYKKKIPFFHLGSAVYQLGYGSNSRLINKSTTDLDSNIGARLSNDKIMTSNIIRMAGLPAPVNGVSINIENATVIAKKLGWPIVVKPVDADRGEGVSVGIKNNKQLEVAFEKAKRYSKSKRIIIEREVKGVAHRILVANEKLIYAVKRLPISIEGDGVKKVSELIQEANENVKSKPPWLRKKLFPNDKEALEAMKLSSYTMSSIPKKEELVPLRIIESTASGGTPQNVTDIIHKDNIDIALRVVKLFGLEVSGVDIISEDITKPWHVNGAIINEINYAPAFGISEISRNSMPAYLDTILNNNGRIPISFIIGGNKAMSVALEKQNELIKQGVSCFVSSHNVTVNGLRKGMILPFNSLYKRCKSLLMNIQVEAIILVVQTDELIHSGIPCCYIDNIIKVDEEIVSSKNLQEKLPKTRVKTLWKLLNQLP